MNFRCAALSLLQCLVLAGLRVTSVPAAAVFEDGQRARVLDPDSRGWRAIYWHANSNSFTTLNPSSLGDGDTASFPVDSGWIVVSVYDMTSGAWKQLIPITRSSY